MGLFTDLFSDQPAKDAAAAKIAGINNGLTAANTALSNGQTQANGFYDQAAQPFSALSATGADTYGKFSGAYADATGVNGADGIARGGSTFKALPGYSGGLTTGIDAVNRGAAARGLLGSGQTSADEIKFASDYDANKYGNYLTSLVPGMQSGQSLMTAGASGQGAVRGAQAGMAANIAGQQAQYGNNAATGIGNANADAETAKYGASKNFWGALMGGAQMLAGMPPTSFGSMSSPSGSSGGSSGGWGNMFGGGSGPITYGGPNGPTQFYGA